MFYPIDPVEIGGAKKIDSLRVYLISVCIGTIAA